MSSMKAIMIRRSTLPSNPQCTNALNRNRLGILWYYQLLNKCVASTRIVYDHSFRCSVLSLHSKLYLLYHYHYIISLFITITSSRISLYVESHSLMQCLLPTRESSLIYFIFHNYQSNPFSSFLLTFIKCSASIFNFL
jgi:hypothetical protein